MSEPAASRPILCVNLNAAIDKTVTVDRLTLGAIHRPQSLVATPGGKGANVARVLNTLGEAVVVTGWVGGYAGRFVESGLRAEGIETALVHTKSESRTCLSILDLSNNTLTEIYEPGAPISAAALTAFRKRYQTLLPKCALVTLSGSLPAQTPASIYAELISAARCAGVPVLLDASREPLRLGLEARPTLVKPNRQEFCTLVGQDLASLAEIAAAAQDLAKRWETTVVISLGADGAIAARGQEIWTARPPGIPARSAVGSGDAMLAGMAAGLVRGDPLPDCLRLGIAAGAANTLSLGAGRLMLGDLDAILPEVRIRQLK